MEVPRLSDQQLEEVRRKVTARAIKGGVDPKAARHIVNIFIEEQRFQPVSKYRNEE
jgi:hypothetical protein